MFTQRKLIEITNELTGEVKNYDAIYPTYINNRSGYIQSDNSRYVVERNKKMGLIDEKGNELCELKYIFEFGYCDDISCYEGFYCVKNIDENKFGFIDRNGKELGIIKYDWVENFCNDFAKVRLCKKYGFINKEGKEICKIEYEEVNFFDEGQKATVKKNGKLGIIDGNGNVLCDFKYYQITRTPNDELWKAENFDECSYTILDEKLDFKEVIPFFDEVRIIPENPQEIRVKRNDKIATFSRDGKMLVDFK